MTGKISKEQAADMHMGGAIAMSGIDAIEEGEAVCGEKALLWEGIICGLYGMAQASIGVEALRRIHAGVGAHLETAEKFENPLQ